MSLRLATTTATHAFPVDVLEGCETALVIFAAAFGGRQDAAHIRDAGLWAMCVDCDEDALERMQDDYPDDWEFICTDAFEPLHVGQADVVTLDPYTGLQMTRTLRQLGEFAKLARKALIVGHEGGSAVWPPDGWRVSHRVKRTTGIFWTVLVPA